MNPFYFGTSEKPLFGNYYLPQSHPAHGSGIVLCYPFGQEYLWMHRAYRQLGVLFSRAGFYVLRFDYYGCGDSGGEAEEGHVNQWLEDIAAAIDEIKDASGLASVSLVGFRLGATLSSLAASGRNDVDNVVLWDPVVNGDRYVDELLQIHSHWAENNLPDASYASKTNGSFEIMGFPLTSRLRNDLEKINLLDIQQSIADRVCLIDSGKASSDNVFFEHLDKTGHRVDYNHIPGSKEWISSAGLNPLSVPDQVLQPIVAWITGGNA